MTLTRQAEPAIASVGRDHAAAPAMSHFMLTMLERRLDGEAAGVEGDALADEREVRSASCGA